MPPGHNRGSHRTPERFAARAFCRAGRARDRGACGRHRLAPRAARSFVAAAADGGADVHAAAAARSAGPDARHDRRSAAQTRTARRDADRQGTQARGIGAGAGESARRRSRAAGAARGASSRDPARGRCRHAIGDRDRHRDGGAARFARVRAGVPQPRQLACRHAAQLPPERLLPRRAVRQRPRAVAAPGRALPDTRGYRRHALRHARAHEPGRGHAFRAFAQGL
jgi:hypothetical protein